MKNLKFVDFCKGIMFLLIGIGIASFGIASISNNSAKADSPNTTDSTGKYMMDQTSFVYNGQYYYNILVWDTETGKSKLFELGQNSWNRSNLQLPSSPIY